MAELVRTDPSGDVVRHLLPRTGVVIGRALDCEIQIVDGFTSRRHARIAHTNEGWILEDLGSMNGCFVNQLPVRRCRLRERDRVRVGTYVFELVASHDLAPPPAGDDGDPGTPATALLFS